jgi:arylsulfatase A-like enzyme
MFKPLFYCGLMITPVLMMYYYAINMSYQGLFKRTIAVAALAWLLLIMQKLIQNRLLRITLSLAFLLVVMTVEFSETISFYLSGISFDEAFFFHVNPTTVKQGFYSYPWIGIVFLTFCLLVFLGELFFDKKKNSSAKYPLIQLIVAFMLFAFLPNSFNYLGNGIKEFYFRSNKTALKYDEIVNKSVKSGVSTDIKTKLDWAVKAPSKKKNLMFIYLESLEQSYFNEKVFPGLVPNLIQLKSKGVSFENLKQTRNTGWTIAGMFASQCGLPLSVERISRHEGNDIIYSSGKNRLVCLGDILRKAGYYQVFMGGADLRFAGKGKHYEDHGYDEVKGLNELKSHIPKSSKVFGWGIHDQDLLTLVHDEFVKLSEQSKGDKPFNLTALTLDTHHPNGHSAAVCPKYKLHDNTMLNAVHCSDFLVGKMLKSLEEKKLLENTLVFVMSDHLALRNVAQPFYPKERRLTAFAFGDDIKPESIATPGAYYDVEPTLLDLLGVSTDIKFPMGESLLKKKTHNPNRFAGLNTKDGKDVFRWLMNNEFYKGNICKEEGVKFNLKDKTIIQGNYRQTLSYIGVVRTPTSSVLLSRITPDGNIIKTWMTTAKDAQKLVDSRPDDIWFIASREGFPKMKEVTTANKNKFRMYFGKPSSKNFFVKDNSELSNLSMSRRSCREVVRKR